MNIENPATFTQVLNTGYNLFVGAGFSILAQNADNDYLPLGNQLADKIRLQFPELSNNSLSLSKLCTILSSTHKKQLDDLLINTFTIPDNHILDEVYYNLLQTRIKNIYTTNIDNLFHKIFAKSSKFFIRNSQIKGPSFNNNAVNLYQLHGSVINKDSDRFFNVFDIATAFSRNQGDWNSLSCNMKEYPTIFIGYAAEDNGLFQTFSELMREKDQIKDIWMVITQNETTDDNIQYYKSLGMNIIVSDTEEFLRELPNYITFNQNQNDSNNLFLQEYMIPDPSKITVRPIEYFYMGDTPQWSDIYSKSIYTLSKSKKIVESLYSNKDVLMIGVPGSGKTTLLMQLAISMDTYKEKRFLSNITNEAASIICEQVTSEAILFIDNICYDIESLKILRKNKKIQICCCDNDFRYFSTSHLIDISNIDLYDITELELSDITRIIENIPAIYKTKSDLMKFKNISIYELVSEIIRHIDIKHKYIDMLKQLRQDDPIQMEIIILTAYVSYCGTALSMNMLYSYVPDDYKDPEKLYTLINNIGKTLKEYNLSYDSQLQDCYQIRSNIITEVFLQGTSQKDLRNVLYLFYKNVNINAISDFYVFKRKAFDTDIIEKAFLNKDEGSKFYDMIYRSIQSPYVLQQKALYLLHKDAVRDAFFTIDQALKESKEKNGALENTHAIILFKANIHLASIDENVRQYLDKSMSILESCYNWDKRKIFHAIVFADHAIQYHKVYDDEISKTYLIKAKNWLLKEQPDNRSRSRNIKFLLKDIDYLLA